MKKLVLLVALVAGLFAVENGHYRCVNTMVVKGDRSYKLSQDEYSYAQFTIKGHTLNDGTNNFKYSYTNNKEKIDFYVHPKMTLGVRSGDVGNTIFPMVAAPAKADYTLVFYCKRVKN